MEEVQQRSLMALKELESLHRGKHILVVSHAITLRLLLIVFEKRSLNDLWKVADIKQTSVTEIEMSNDEIKIVRKADASHL